MKKVLWVNPSFLDYRIPLYDELNKLYQNNFHLIYSKQRVPQRCIDKIESVLKENALGLLTEKNVSIGKKDGFANSRISLPIPKGLYRLIKSVKADIVIAEGFFLIRPTCASTVLVSPQNSSFHSSCKIGRASCRERV